MIRSFNQLLSLHTIGFLALFTFVSPPAAKAWTSAFLDTVKVDVALDEQGLAEITTRARFVVEGGRFHGFDLARLDDANLVKEECYARRDGGGKLHLEYKKLSRGRTRITLTNDYSVRRGAINFYLVHKSDFAAHDYLRFEDDTAVLDWTPMVWSSGLSAMSTTVHLAGADESRVRFDEKVIANYESRVETGQFSLTKYRPVRWYNMRVHAHLDPALFAAKTAAKSQTEEPEEIPAVAATLGQSPPGPPTPSALGAAFSWWPLIATLLAALLLLYKAARVHHIHRLVDVPPRFLLLPNTSVGLRTLLTGSALLFAGAAQSFGPLVAGIPPLAVAAGLWLFARAPLGAEPSRSAENGAWRPLDDEEISRYKRLTRAYLRARISLVDITTLGGAIGFALIVAGLAASAWWLYPVHPKAAWMTVINGLIFAIPTWFASVHGDLPADHLLESFELLKRWPKSLAHLSGFASPKSPSTLYVLEDATGIVDIRLRISPDLGELKHVEIACEPVTVGSLQRTRPVIILRLEAGSERAKLITDDPHAAEHYLTPDLEDEVIILRDRRGTFSAGIAPLRSAIAHF